MRVGPQRRLSIKELMFANYGAGEDSFWPIDAKSQLTGKDPDAWKN